MTGIAASISNGSEIYVDVCILGAGAAGIALAKSLNGSKLSVALVESGQFEQKSEIQKLNEGLSTFPDGKTNAEYLLQSRQRCFGGSTATWAGHCHPFMENDFSERGWVPSSGWPIKKELLDDYYSAAARLVEINDFPSESEEILKTPNMDRKGQGNFFSSVVFQTSPPTRFGVKYRKEILGSKNIRLFLDCSADEIVTSENGKEVTAVNIVTTSKKRFQVKAKKVILALGGIENARLLLASRSSTKQGLGNDNDLVGRYFMEHLFGIAGFALINKEAPFSIANNSFVKRFKNPKVHLVLNSEQQKKHSALACGFYFETAKEPGLFAERAIKANHEAAVSKLALQSGIRNLDLRKVIYFLEQAPNPESRVRLSMEKNILGQYKPKLEWKISDMEEKSLRVATELLGREMGASAGGRLRVDESSWYLKRGWAAHHMGTTRMHSNSKKGVVNADCRVHGIENLFIAGSSVFPTGGAANPTLTIIALALRLADHIKAQV
jgi:choline dehydrogenase-like flavoprotein